MFKLIPLVVVASLIVLGFFSATLTLLDYSPVAPEISAPVTPKSIAVTEATTLPQLPHFVREEKFADDWDGEYLLQWGSIEGLNARASGAKPIVKYHPTLTLVPVPTEGMHGLGNSSRGAFDGPDIQVGVWLKAVPNTKIGLRCFRRKRRDQWNQYVRLGRRSCFVISWSRA